MSVDSRDLNDDFITQFAGSELWCEGSYDAWDLLWNSNGGLDPDIKLAWDFEKMLPSTKRLYKKILFSLCGKA